MSMEEENKAIMRRVLEALDQQDFERSRSTRLHQAVAHQPMVRAAFPDLRTTIEHQVAEGDTVATRATLRGTHRGPLFGVEPTNQALTWIVLHHANADWIGVLMKLGSPSSILTPLFKPSASDCPVVGTPGRSRPPNQGR